MTNFPILDLVAGMIFVFFLLSIISSSAVEMILTGGKFRAKALEKWLTDIFKETVTLAGGTQKPLGMAIMDHCTVTALSGTGKSTSYIAAPNFVSALLEKISFDPQNPDNIPADIAAYKTVIQNSTALPPELKRVFLMYATEAQNAATETLHSIDLFKGKIENWFDSNMDRVGGYLKTTYTRPFTFLVAAVTALALNADSIAIAKYLYNNPDARAKVAASAYAAAHDDKYQQQVDALKRSLPAAKNDTTVATLQQLTDSLNEKWKELNIAKAALEDNSIPLGWSSVECKDKQGWNAVLFVLGKFAGLFATFLAITMGAPFWFDVLNKVSNLRGTGTKPQESKNKNTKK